MPNEFAIRPPGPARSPATPEPRAPPPAASRPAASPAPFSELPNPSLRIDPVLGMVVIEFRDSAGRMTRSFPDPRQLAAYREAARTGTPAGAGTQAGTAPRPIHQTATGKT